MRQLLDILSKKKGVLPKLKHLAQSVLHQKDSPDQIAGGVAVGLFFAFAAPPGLQIVFALSATVMLRCNSLAACAMVFVSNPLTMPLIYPFAAYLGSAITGVPLRGVYPISDQGFWLLATNPWIHGRIIVLVMVGCFTLGAVASVTGYYVSKVLVVTYRKRHGAHKE